MDRCQPAVQTEIAYILMELLKYPSNELAEKHRQANKLGCSDIHSSSNKVNTESAVPLEHDRKLDYCEDCGLVVQER